MELAKLLVLFAAAVLAGTLNAVLGGGSFVTFPALVFTGVPAIVANATSSVAVWPAGVASAAAYRRDIRQPLRVIATLSTVSLAGGAIGAWLLLHTRETRFISIVPWLMLAATLIFSFGAPLAERFRAKRSEAEAHAPAGATLLLGAVLQLLISIYGGYFGAGMGILMLAAFSLIGMTDIHAINALRSILAVMINGAAIVGFVLARSIAWEPALVMALGSTAAGYFGAALARKIERRWMRRLLLSLAWGMTGWFFFGG